jgi:hypothetical protein
MPSKGARGRRVCSFFGFHDLPRMSREPPTPHFFLVLGLELRALLYQLSHAPSPDPHLYWDLLYSRKGIWMLESQNVKKLQ